MHGEGVDLGAIDLIAGERARQRVDADVLRLEVAGLFVDLPIERGRLDAAGSRIGGAQHRILAQAAAAHAARP